MTLRNRLAVVVLLLLVTCPALTAGAQRAAARVPPGDSGGGSAESPKAQAREAEPRRAEPRPAQAPAAEAPAAKPSIQLPARDDSHRAISVVVPSVVVPSNVGGVTVGQAFSAGNAFSVGHTTPDTESSPSRGGGGRHHDRADYVDAPVETVFVPVAVPVYVPIAEPTTTEPTEVALVPNRSADRTGALARDAQDSRGARSMRGYFTFTPWYDISTGIMAGYPVPLPPPSTFDEGNVSPTVAETRRESDGDNVRISVLEYAKGVGGVAFAIQPSDTAVFVDGRFVGSTSDYSPKQEPLLLQFGVYTVELRANGYVTERFPVYVKMGEVTPFSGTMTRLEP